ncbi:hypothetical protein BDN72DRAFT_860591 [Pluteus cervinus]|uniref:Uncharacterized protein n=1 Tax=Pluteus cervinus TaxID=181527 RepID=A0ACD3AI82_9AGAR|nr:hypothetical protein BDN72DRAFT_860591 [Pluteus cervinus]
MAYHPILSQRFDTSDIAFNKIDQEILALRETIREKIRVLHAFRNTFTPVYRLPPEILSRIFTLLQYVPKFPGDLHSRRKPTLEWVKVTHVSQHWRDVAIGSPNLWSQISTTYPKCLAEEWLQRSKSAPLSIDLRGSGSLDADRFITPSLFRIRELTLELTSSSWWILSRNLSSPTPLLESLSIMITDGAFYSASSTISDTTFAGTTPRLRFLKLMGCSVDINSSIFTNLEALELRDSPRKMSATDLLTALRNLPRLVSLVVSEVLATGAPLASSSIDSDTIILASLTSLSIRGGSLIQDLDILSHLSFPANTTLRFSSVTQTGESVTSLSDFLRVYNSSHLQESSQPSQVNMDLHCARNFLKLSIQTKYAEPGLMDSSLVFELIGRWGGTLEMPDQIETATLFSYLPLSSLTTFTTNCNIGVNTWITVFGTLPKLRDISVSGSRAVNVLCAIVADLMARCVGPLERMPRPPRNTTQGRMKWNRGGGRQNSQRASTSNSQAVDWVPIFPQLETLELQDMAFPEYTENVITALCARKVVGKGLHYIGITECRNLDKDVLRELGRCVCGISWDGHVGLVGRDEEEVEDEYMHHLLNLFLPMELTTTASLNSMRESHRGEFERAEDRANPATKSLGSNHHDVPVDSPFQSHQEAFISVLNEETNGHLVYFAAAGWTGRITWRRTLHVYGGTVEA